MNTKACPKCHQLAVIEAKFCGQCGQQFIAPNNQQAQSQPIDSTSSVEAVAPSDPSPQTTSPHSAPAPQVQQPPQSKESLDSLPKVNIGPNVSSQSPSQPQTVVPPLPVTSPTTPPPASSQPSSPPASLFQPSYGPTTQASPQSTLRPNYVPPVRSGGSGRKIGLVLVAIITPIVLIGVVLLFFLYGRGYAKAGITCESAQFDTSLFSDVDWGLEDTVRDELVDTFEGIISYSKVCEFEDKQYEIYKESELTQVANILVNTVIQETISGFFDSGDSKFRTQFIEESCSDTEFISGLRDDFSSGVTLVDSDAFIAVDNDNDIVDLIEALDNNGFETSDYKPEITLDICNE